MKHPWNPHLFAEGARAASRDEDFVRAANAAAQAIKGVHPDLPVILSLSHFAHLTGVSANWLHAIISRRRDPYRLFRLKKTRSPVEGAAPARSFRLICVPEPSLMRAQRWIAQNILNVIERHPASFAFAPGCRLKDAAARHSRCRWLVKMDVRNFFESIMESSAFKVFSGLGYGALLSFEFARLCTRAEAYGPPVSDDEPMPYSPLSQGHLPQGAPTSPMLANLAVRKLDERLTALATHLGWSYTRYADDLAFSTREKSSRHQSMRLVSLVKRELRSSRLEPNDLKTRITPPGARRVVLGLIVDGLTPRLSRAFRDNIETHLYALGSPRIGVAAHIKKRGFASKIGMKRHLKGLIAFAHQVEPHYALNLYRQFDDVDWST